MWVRAKDEGHAADSIKSHGESTNPMGQLRVPIHPFPQLGLHGLPLSGKLDITRVHNT